MGGLVRDKIMDSRVGNIVNNVIGSEMLGRVRISMLIIVLGIM